MIGGLSFIPSGGGKPVGKEGETTFPRETYSWLMFELHAHSGKEGVHITLSREREV